MDTSLNTNSTPTLQDLPRKRYYGNLRQSAVLFRPLALTSALASELNLVSTVMARAKYSFCQQEVDQSELKRCSRCRCAKLPDDPIPSHLMDGEYGPRSALARMNPYSHGTPSAFSYHLKSKECQTLSWKVTHKYNRQRRDPLHGDDDDKHSTRGGNIPAPWFNAGAISLCGAAAAVQLDLANHEPDYLLIY